MSKTKIPWATHSINPIRVEGGGWHCTKISPGCQNCYSETMNMRFGNKIPYDNRRVEYELDISCFDKLPKSKPAIVFVQSMSDLFHEDVHIQLIDEVFEKTFDYPQHKFLILTKRSERMAEYAKRIDQCSTNYPNVWLGVTVENQGCRWQIDELFKISVAIKFVSCEPLLSKIDLTKRLEQNEADNFWVIVGAESGSKRRECKLEWVRNIVKQCKNAGTPVFVKQLHINGKVSHDMNEWPEDLRIQEWPV